MTDDKQFLPFQKRFNINVTIQKAQLRFVNRVSNTVVNDFFYRQISRTDAVAIEKQVANALGIRLIKGGTFEDYTQGDYLNTLLALEAVYASNNLEGYQKIILSDIIKSILDLSEIELGIRWEKGYFIPSGVKFLDDILVDENLNWLAEPKYSNVLTNFREGLTHFLEANQNPKRLPDVIEDMYKAMESTAKAVTGKDWDLSKNRQLFIKNLGISEHYSKLLYQYIDYANSVGRHGAEPETTNSLPSYDETEAFIYLTGLFIRFSLNQLRKNNSQDKGAL